MLRPPHAVVLLALLLLTGCKPVEKQATVAASNPQANAAIVVADTAVTVLRNWNPSLRDGQGSGDVPQAKPEPEPTLAPPPEMSDNPFLATIGDAIDAAAGDGTYSPPDTIIKSPPRNLSPEDDPRTFIKRWYRSSSRWSYNGREYSSDLANHIRNTHGGNPQGLTAEEQVRLHSAYHEWENAGKPQTFNAAMPVAAKPGEEVVKVYLFTQKSCVLCPAEVAKKKAVAKKTGVERVAEMGFGGKGSASDIYKISGTPTWVVVYKNGTYRKYRNGDKIPAVSDKMTYGAINGPAIKVTDLINAMSVGGKHLQLNPTVAVDVPQNMKWKATTAQDGTVRIMPSPQPTITITKFIRLKLALLAVQITTTSVVVEIDNFPDIRVAVDWN